MKYHFIPIFLLIACSSPQKTQETGMDFLTKSIAYHDPDNLWPTAAMKLIFHEMDEERQDVIREVSIINQTSEFVFYQKDDEKEIQFSVQQDTCDIMLNSARDFTDDEREKFRLNCEQGRLYRNYYGYLYGLPMKLRDPGTIVHPDVIEEEFNGKSYYSIRITYDEEVGSDTWYFYLDKTTYALSGYRFQHNVEEHDGEYVTLDGIIEHNSMKIPKTRTWYYNKTGEFLGVDDLDRIEAL